MPWVWISISPWEKQYSNSGNWEKKKNSINEAFHPETKVLDEILEKCKSHGNKWGLGYISETKTPTSGGIVFIKGKEETPNQATSSSTHSLCIHCKKSWHTPSRCHTRFLEKYKSQLNMLLDEFNSLKNNILNTRKEKKTNSKSKTHKSFSKSPPKVQQVWTCCIHSP